MTQDSEGWCKIEGAMSDRTWRQFLCNQQFILFGDGQWGTMGKEQQSRWMMILIGVDSCWCWQMTIDNEGRRWVEVATTRAYGVRKWFPLISIKSQFPHKIHSFSVDLENITLTMIFRAAKCRKIGKIFFQNNIFWETNGLKLYFCETFISNNMLVID